MMSALLIAVMVALSPAPDRYAVDGSGQVLGQTDDPIAEWSAEQWASYSRNIVAALASRNRGLEESALRTIIRYGEQLDVEAALADMVRIYRNHPEENMRRMAVVAMGKTGSPLAVDYLQRLVRFEYSPAVRHTMQAVIAEHVRTRSGS
jgi:HEAT repeat protein